MGGCRPLTAIEERQLLIPDVDCRKFRFQYFTKPTICPHRVRCLQYLRVQLGRLQKRRRTVRCIDVVETRTHSCNTTSDIRLIAHWILRRGYRLCATKSYQFC